MRVEFPVNWGELERQAREVVAAHGHKICSHALGDPGMPVHICREHPELGHLCEDCATDHVLGFEPIPDGKQVLPVCFDRCWVAGCGGEVMGDTVLFARPQVAHSSWGTRPGQIAVAAFCTEHYERASKIMALRDGQASVVRSGFTLRGPALDRDWRNGQALMMCGLHPEEGLLMHERMAVHQQEEHVTVPVCGACGENDGIHFRGAHVISLQPIWVLRHDGTQDKVRGGVAVLPFAYICDDCCYWWAKEDVIVIELGMSARAPSVAF
jgi:hypothetical protein